MMLIISQKNFHQHIMQKNAWANMSAHYDRLHPIWQIDSYSQPAYYAKYLPLA